MEMEIQKRVMRITKAQANTIAEESGVEKAISDDVLKQYLQQVLEEIQHRITTILRIISDEILLLRYPVYHAFSRVFNFVCIHHVVVTTILDHLIYGLKFPRQVLGI
jgi:hypothetical protein